jgi:tetratricopeptide (TPR) repeat protein
VTDEPRATVTSSQRVRKLGVRLGILLAVTAGSFLGTGALARHVRGRAERDAAILHERGMSQLRAGQTDAALASLRGASTGDRRNTAYALSYAQALRAQGQLTSAERVLVLLRAEAPDRPETNLELARIAAARRDVEMAVRYYRYALYAPWPDPGRAPRVRDELIAFLLEQGDRTRATSELIAARATLPDEASAHLQLGTRFAEAGEHRLALEEFRRAAQLDPASRDARRATGNAAFETGDYRLAVASLADAGVLDADSAHRLAIARAVLSLDPLVPRLAPATRVDRMLELIKSTLNARLACPPVDASADRTADLEALRLRIRRSGGRDLELLADAVDAAYTELESLSQSCPVDDPAAQALLIIGEQHGNAAP